jgi:molybdopterin molybdotransferase
LDDDADLTAALRSAIGAGEPEMRRGAEAVILTGGVSMGHRDSVRSAVELLGAEIVCHGLPQRPGKPILTAVLNAGEGGGVAPVPIFGLPGNPVSAMVTGTRIVLPVLTACAGAVGTPAALAPRLVELAVDDGKRLNLWWHRPARLVVRADGTPLAELIDTRGSGDVVAAARSDGFVEMPPARASLRDNTSRVVPFYSWPA